MTLVLLRCGLGTGEARADRTLHFDRPGEAASAYQLAGGWTF